MRAWLTPDDPPDGEQCFQLTIPGGEEYAAIFRGALVPLFSPANFEQFGSQTPEETAQAFVDALVSLTEGCGSDMVNPVGEIFAFAGDTAPSDSLACDGSQVLESAYPELFAVCGTLWGSADSGYFRLPDLRSRVLVGAGQGSGLTEYAVADAGGEETHVLTEEELAIHLHYITGEVNYHDNTAAGGTSNRLRDTSAGTAYGMVTDSSGGDEPHENRPPFAGVLWCIWATP
jgi:microcystin-dependent protein